MLESTQVDSALEIQLHTKLAGAKLEIIFICRDRNYMCLGVKGLDLKLVGSQWAIVG